MSPVRFLTLCFFTFLTVGSVPLHAQREKLPLQDLEIVEKRWPKAKRTYTTLRYIVLKEGDKSGPTPMPGMMVSALYKGMLLNDTVFDEMKEFQKPPKHPPGGGGGITPFGGC